MRICSFPASNCQNRCYRFFVSFPSKKLELNLSYSTDPGCRICKIGTNPYPTFISISNMNMEKIQYNSLRTLRLPVNVSIKGELLSSVPSMLPRVQDPAQALQNAFSFFPHELERDRVEIPKPQKDNNENYRINMDRGVHHNIGSPIVVMTTQLLPLSP